MISVKIIIRELEQTVYPRTEPDVKTW